MSGTAPGDAGALATWRFEGVTTASMEAWVDMLRDDNRIHVDPHVAEAMGYGFRTVNPGPANLAYVLNMLLDACPGSYPTRIEARFLGNVLSDDAVEVTGERRPDGRIHAELRIAGGGQPALDVAVVMGPLAR